MSGNLAFLDNYPSMRIAELLREAHNDRLADLAKRPGRPVRARLANWLYAVAAWLDGSSQPSTARARA